MKLKFDVTAKEYGILRDILTDMLPPDSRVWVFGSRAKNTVRFNSDIDLALEPAKGKALPKGSLARLKDAFNDAPLPYRVDVLDINDVSEKFQTIIRQQAIAFPLAKSDKVPKLRFTEFSGDWKNTTVEGLGRVVTGSTPDTSKSEYYGGEIPFFSPSDLSCGGGLLTAAEKKITEFGFTKTRSIPADSTLFVCIGSTIGKVGKTTRQCATNQQINSVIPNRENDQDFVHFALVSAAKKIRKLTAVQAVPIINKTTFGREKISKTSLPEQRKIAAFLSAIDTKIDQTAKKKALLEQYKKGCMQKLFSQELRFKDAQGKDFPDWVEKRLGEVFTEVIEKVGQRDLEAYSITAGHGFVSQKEKFGRDISGRQNSKYTALSNGQFSYNKGNSKTYKYGCVYLNETDKQIAVPNVFISFELIDNAMDAVFFAKLFEHHYLDRGLRQIISSSARMDGLLNVNKKYFFKLKILGPPPPEQRKIAAFLSAIDTKIDLITTKLEHAQAFKKGLLQQMFI